MRHLLSVAMLLATFACASADTVRTRDHRVCVFNTEPGNPTFLIVSSWGTLRVDDGNAQTSYILGGLYIDQGEVLWLYGTSFLEDPPLYAGVDYEPLIDTNWTTIWRAENIGGIVYWTLVQDYTPPPPLPSPPPREEGPGNQYQA